MSIFIYLIKQNFLTGHVFRKRNQNADSAPEPLSPLFQGTGFLNDPDSRVEVASAELTVYQIVRDLPMIKNSDSIEQETSAYEKWRTVQLLDLFLA
jgi:hypothetical protein